MISILKDRCDLYFEYFNNQDIIKLEEMFSDDIQLIDWDVSANNKESVLNVIKNIFKNNKDLKIFKQTYHQEEDTVCCQIKIHINNSKTILDVIDVITFSDDLKIKKINAYKK